MLILHRVTLTQLPVLSLISAAMALQEQDQPWRHHKAQAQEQDTVPFQALWTALSAFSGPQFSVLAGKKLTSQCMKRFSFGQTQDLSLQAMSYLGSTLQPDHHLNDAVNTHSVILQWVTSTYQSSMTYRFIIMPFFSTYWQTAFERNRGHFRTPQRVQAMLSRALAKPEGQRAQAILQAIALGLGGDASI